MSAPFDVATGQRTKIVGYLGGIRAAGVVERCCPAIHLRILANAGQARHVVDIFCLAALARNSVGPRGINTTVAKNNLRWRGAGTEVPAASPGRTRIAASLGSRSARQGTAASGFGSAKEGGGASVATTAGSVNITAGAAPIHALGATAGLGLEAFQTTRERQ